MMTPMGDDATRAMRDGRRVSVVWKYSRASARSFSRSRASTTDDARIIAHRHAIARLHGGSRATRGDDGRVDASARGECERKGARTYSLEEYSWTPRTRARPVD